MRLMIMFIYIIMEEKKEQEQNENIISDQVSEFRLSNLRPIADDEQLRQLSRTEFPVIGYVFIGINVVMTILCTLYVILKGGSIMHGLKIIYV